jgi:hypothetical protein
MRGVRALGDAHAEARVERDVAANERGVVYDALSAVDDDVME